MIDYNKIYNTPGSKKKVDRSWERCIERGNIMMNRFQYSIDQLYGDVLDVGAADGTGPFLMSKNPKVTSVTCLEVQDAAIEKMKRNLRGKDVKIVKGAIEYVDLNRRFDCVHCGHTLEHVEDLDASLRGLERHTGERAVISVPINGGVSIMHLREFTEVREVLELFSKYFFITGFAKFKTAGRADSLVVICERRDG